MEFFKMLFELIVLTIIIVIQYLIAKEFELVARQKGHAESKYFHMCFWLSIVGYLLVIALPDRGSNNQKDAMNKDSGGVSAVEPLVWEPVQETTAIVSGETNIKCANCHRVQFKGNTTCSRCGAKFTALEEKQ